MLITIKCLYINMQDIANNNRLINTAENLPHPKRPFNKLPIVISLEISFLINFTQIATGISFSSQLFFLY